MYQEIYKPKVVYGPVEGYQKRECVEEYILAVHQDIADVKNRYIRLGFHLNEINRYKYYHDVGYSDFYEFCKNNYGLSKTETSRCINIMVRFCRRNEGCPENVTMFLDKKYEQYSYSQLGEMLPLDDAEIRKISPSMTVKDIREFKKRKKKPKEKMVSAERSDVGTEKPKKKQPSEDIKKIPVKIESRQLLLNVIGIAFNKYLEKFPIDNIDMKDGILSVKGSHGELLDGKYRIIIQKIKNN